MDFSFQLRRAMETGKVLLGFRQTEKSLLNGRAKLIIVSLNPPEREKRRILHLAKLAGIPVYSFPGTSIELGYTAGKPFRVSFIAVEDPGDSEILRIAEEKA